MRGRGEGIGRLWERVQRTKEFNGQAAERVRLILPSVVLSAALPLALLIPLLLLSVAPPAQAQGGYSPWRTFNTWNSGLAHNVVQAILQDSEGNLWFGGTSFGGVSRYDGASWQSFTTENSSLAANVVQVILQDGEGDLWFGTGWGVSRYDGASWQSFTPENSGLALNAVRAILQDREGNLWFGTREGGVSRYDGVSWQSFTTENSGLADNDVWAILQDGEGHLWFGTWGGGVSRYDGASWQSFTTENSGLARNDVGAILQDSEGNLWFGTSGGVSRYDGVSWQTLTTENSGLADNDVEAILQNGEGALWFGTNDGISRHIVGTAPPIIVYLNLITTGGQVYTSTGQITLPYSQRDITFEFASGDLKTDREDLRYVYKLEGHDPDWQVTTEPFQETARYFDLPSGTYTFVVQARDMDFNYSEPAHARITILPSPIQVYGLLGLLATLLLVLAAISISHWQASHRIRQAIKRKFNPYLSGLPVREPDMFFGREEALAEVLDTIHNNHVAIYGERRIGKTSFLHQLDNRLREAEDPQYLFIPAFVSLQGVPAERLFYTLMSVIARSCRPHIGSLDLIYATKKEGYDVYDLVDDLEMVLEALKATTDKQLRLVLLLDEGDELNEYDPKVQARLRRVLMSKAGQHLRMIWSGLSIDREWKLGTSPWYNLFAIEKHLPPFTLDEALRLIQEPVKGIYRYDKDAIELILQYSEHKPFRIQQICLATINRVLAQKRRRVTGPIWVTREDVERAYQGLAAGEAISREVAERGKVGLLEKQVAEGQTEYQVNTDGQGDQ
ncbi:MAG: hypothetical protein E3J21_15385 [Anaerolineales bacterium]|nr:MAG: hypothetical protein E3J21_15385 [Anaerolineales bacterium]